MFKDIQVGDSVTMSTPQGQLLNGKAVMKGPYGWVINVGGRHGTPRVVHENNFVKMRKGKNRKPDFFGDFHYGV
tara:strand:+ start:258 stop:479 length:222 start_codon:yes stop_codon:yes gene_type:complete